MRILLLGLLGVVMCAGYPRLQFDGGGRQDLLQNDNNNNGGVDTKYSLRNLVDHQVLKKDSLYDKHKAFNEENHQVSTFSELTKSLQFSGELTDNLGFHSSSSGKNLEVLGVDHDGDHLRSRRSIIGNNEVNYLSKFGYLPQSILETGALTTDHQLKNAIRNLQSFAGIPESGELDEETRGLMTKKRCGVHDVSTGFRNRKKRYTLQGERWHSGNLSWSLAELGPGTGLPRHQVVQQLNLALQVWAAKTVLQFQFMGDSDQADLQVSFHRGYHGDGYPFDGIGSVLAHAFYPGSGRGGDAHFDEEELWSTEGRSDGGRTSLYAVALHEFGHSLGLSHSSVRGSVMFPWYSSADLSYSLPQDDTDAIQRLYGTPTSEYRPDRPSTKKTTVNIETTTASPTTGFTSTTAASFVPSKCETSFDAVAVIRSEMWAFKGRYFWRINKEGGTREDPVELSGFWYGLPSDIDHVDAVLEKQNHDIVFFVGKKFYVMSGNSQLKRGPQSLTKLGLPSSLDKIDGAMKWGYNQKTYFFSGDMYWRFDDEEQVVELDYPRDINMWKGVPRDIDAVFQYTDKKTYFFKNQSFWEFDDVRMSVVRAAATPVGEHWFHCPRDLHDPLVGSAHKHIPSVIHVFAFSILAIIKWF